MIELAVMRPARSQSGRRYFRGRDVRGNVFWLMEEIGSEGHRWLLKVDQQASSTAPEDALKAVDGTRVEVDPRRLEEG